MVIRQNWLRIIALGIAVNLDVIQFDGEII